MWWTPSPASQTPIAVKILLTLALAGFALFAFLYFGRSPEVIYQRTPGPTQYVPVPVKVAGKEVRVPIPVEVKKIELVPVEVVRERMKWPEVTDNTVLAVGEVPPHRGKTSVIAVGAMDNDTLRTRLVMRPEPVPFLELKKEVRLGAFYGNGGVFSPEVALRPLRVGPVNVVLKGTGMYGAGVNETRAFIGAEVEFGF